MLDFLYTAQPARVIFGAGRIAELRSEVERVGIRRALVLSTAGRVDLAEMARDRIDDLAAGGFSGARMHTPTATTDKAMAVLRELDADGFVAIGGGSTIGLGKALALRTGLPQIAVPTTYAGSEMTPVVGETNDGVKSTRSSPDVLPQTVLYDVELTLSLPPTVSATSGINAIAHAVEALYARDRNPIIDMMAKEGVSTLAEALPVIVENPLSGPARSKAQYGAWLCGTCLGAVGMSLHHKLCHVLGGTFGLPHAETHAIVLPHALAFNASHAGAAIAALSEALRTSDPVVALYDLAGTLGVPRSLSAIGMPQGGVAEVVDRTLAAPYWNPRPLEKDSLRRCLERAWAGLPPQSDGY